jgi:hydantoinase/carbamoylase family amidase
MIADLRALATLTATEHGAQRVAWTETWAQARRFLRARLAELPTRVEIDEAGNLWATLEGASPHQLIIGSHIDSVPNGGWLDGCLGVFAALEVLRGVAGGPQPPISISLVDWADEEGARFGLSLMGSAAATGRLDRDLVHSLRDAEGMTAVEALAAHGVDVDRMPRARRRLEHARGYIELHIEQGPVLDTRALALGVVTGTLGAERWAVRFDGQAAHAGSTPMDQRRDALASAARFALEVRERSRSHGGVGTVGAIHCEPGIPTAIPGRATAFVDQRHADADALAAIRAGTERASRRIAAEEGVEVSWSPLFRIAPVAFDPALIESCAEIVTELQGVDVRLPSGALHDAANLAGAGVPTVMLFVRSKRGLSHTREEDTDEPDLALALRALDRLARNVIADGR